MTKESHGALAPSAWVARWSHLVAPAGAVLDVACGAGRHTRWFAAHGHAVTAVDRDAAVSAPLREIAEVVVADLEAGPWPFVGRRFAAIVVTNYLWRDLTPRLHEALADGGVLIHETFSIDQASIGKPSNPAFLLRRTELLDLAEGLRVVAFEDGFIDTPERFVQRIVAVRESVDIAASARYPLRPGPAPGAG